MTQGENGKIKGKPGMTAQTQAEKAAREDRLAKALRENLKRRKAQARERVPAKDTEE